MGFLKEIFSRPLIGPKGRGDAGIKPRGPVDRAILRMPPRDVRPPIQLNTPNISNIQNEQGQPAGYSRPIAYADQNTIDTLLQQLRDPSNTHHRWGHGDPLMGVRGILADALDEAGRGEEAGLLRMPNRHVLVTREGQVRPGRMRDEENDEWPRSTIHDTDVDIHRLGQLHIPTGSMLDHLYNGHELDAWDLERASDQALRLLERYDDAVEQADKYGHDDWESAENAEHAQHVYAAIQKRIWDLSETEDETYQPPQQFSRYSAQDERGNPVQYDSGRELTPEEKSRARKVDLIVLPSYIPGTSCGSCRYFNADGDCSHPMVRMKVESRYCCREWDAYGVERVAGGTSPAYYERVGVIRYGDEDGLLDAIRRNPMDVGARGALADLWDEIHNGGEENHRTAHLRSGNPLYVSSDGSLIFPGDSVVTVARAGSRMAGRYPLYQTAIYTALPHRDGHLSWRRTGSVSDETSGYRPTGPMVERAKSHAAAVGFPYLEGVRHGYVAGTVLQPAPPPPPIDPDSIDPNQFAGPFMASRYERRHSPTEFDYGEKKYRRGQFIPGTVMFTHKGTNPPQQTERQDARWRPTPDRTDYAEEDGPWTGMNEEAGFHQAMEAGPRDVVTPLVYADWLDEHGHPGLARVIREHYRQRTEAEAKGTQSGGAHTYTHSFRGGWEGLANQLKSEGVWGPHAAAAGRSTFGPTSMYLVSATIPASHDEYKRFHFQAWLPGQDAAETLRQLYREGFGTGDTETRDYTQNRERLFGEHPEPTPPVVAPPEDYTRATAAPAGGGERIEYDCGVGACDVQDGRGQALHELQTAPAEPDKELDGTGEVELVDLPHMRGVWKPAEGETDAWRHGVPKGEYYIREVAASTLADILGFGDLVPPTALRQDGDELGSMQEYVPGETGHDLIQDGHSQSSLGVSPEDVTRAAVFDYILGSEDRHTGNWVIDQGGKITLIDNGISLPVEHDDRDFFEDWLWVAAADHPMPDLTLLRAQWPRVEQAMRGLGIEEEAINLLYDRMDWATSGRYKTFGDLPYPADPHHSVRDRLSRPHPQSEEALEELEHPTTYADDPVSRVRESKRQREASRRRDLGKMDPVEALQKVAGLLELHGPLSQGHILKRSGIPAATLKAALDHAQQHGVLGFSETGTGAKKARVWSLNPGWGSGSFGESYQPSYSTSPEYRRAASLAQAKQKRRLSSLPPEKAVARIQEVLGRHGQLRHGDLARLANMHPEALQAALAHGEQFGVVVGEDQPVPNNPNKTVRVWSLPDPTPQDESGQPL
jgi:uncharacterized protein (TIGR02996 family)